MSKDLLIQAFDGTHRTQAACNDIMSKNLKEVRKIKNVVDVTGRCKKPATGSFIYKFLSSPPPLLYRTEK